jgi:hypothetical protein
MQLGLLYVIPVSMQDLDKRCTTLIGKLRVHAVVKHVTLDYNVKWTL